MDLDQLDGAGRETGAVKLGAWWSQKRDRLTFGMLVTLVLGKGLVLFGLGALLAEWVRPWALALIVIGVALDLITKRRWLWR